MSHSERQEAFKAKARAKGGKHAKTVPVTTKTTTSMTGKEEGVRVKIVPMPSGGGGKTVVGNKTRIGAHTSKLAKGVAAAKVSFAEESMAAGGSSKGLTLEEKVMMKKRKSFEKLAGSVGAAKRAKKEKEMEQ